MLIQIRHFLRGSQELKMENYEFELNSSPGPKDWNECFEMLIVKELKFPTNMMEYFRRKTFTNLRKNKHQQGGQEGKKRVACQKITLFSRF